jgi:hypothetical protein
MMHAIAVVLRQLQGDGNRGERRKTKMWLLKYDDVGVRGFPSGMHNPYAYHEAGALSMK